MYIVSSSEHTDESISTNTGSLFTKVIFDIVSKTQDLCDIFKEYNNINYEPLNKKINLSIYKTVPDTKIWEWVVGIKTRVLYHSNCVIHLNLNLLGFDTYKYSV